METTNKLEKIIFQYIPKNKKCRPDEEKRKYLRQQEKNRILTHIEKMNIGIEIGNHWQEQAPDMSVCSACKETIYGKQFEMKWMLNGEEVPHDRPIKLCEPCYLKRND